MNEQLNDMRELNFKEVEEVSGGFPWVPVIAGGVIVSMVTRIWSNWGDGPRGPMPPALPPRR